MGIGSLVQQAIRGGLHSGQVVTGTLGLIVGEDKVAGAIPQYQVEWIGGPDMGKTLWYYSHDLKEAK
jgi:hypothetical protein